MDVPFQPFVGEAKRRLHPCEGSKGDGPSVARQQNGAFARDRDQPPRVAADAMDGAAKAAMWNSCWSAA